MRIGRWDYNLQRSTEMSHKSSGTKLYGLMRPRLTSTKVREMPKCGERRDLLMIQNIQDHLWSMAWRKCPWLGWLLQAVGSLIFIDDVAHDGSSRMNSEVYKNFLSANLWRNASKPGRSSIMQQDNDPKHTANTTKDFIRRKSGRF